MKTSTGKATKAEQRRFDAMLEIGCLCCLLNGHPETPGEIHHLTSAGRRRGHLESLCLCPGHHRGVFDRPYKEWKEIHGPSFAKEPRQFAEVFADDDTLLEIQDSLVNGYIGG